MNCHKCGAEAKSSGYLGTYFDCGSSWLVELDQSATCRELCDLRKWREVVLSKTEATLGGVYSMMTMTPDKFGTVAEMFDSAVRKEMECES